MGLATERNLTGDMKRKVPAECDYHAALGLGSGLIELLLLALDSKFYKFVPFAVEI